MKIGVQFYTLRNQCTTLEGLETSMKRVADMGYQHIQLSGVCPYEADWMAEKLRETGLSCEITHYSYDKIVSETDATIVFHDTMADGMTVKESSFSVFMYDTKYQADVSGSASAPIPVASIPKGLRSWKRKPMTP